MTPLFLSCLALIALYGIYLAAQTARVCSGPGSFLDADNTLPQWVMIFMLSGLVIAVIGVDRHIGLVGKFGLQASHIGIGLVPVAICALLVWNRVWFATRVASLETPAEALGHYYDSVALRVIMMFVAVLFTLPFAANVLSNVGLLVNDATGGQIPRTMGVWFIGLAIAIASIIGGWRAVIMFLGMISILILLFLTATSIFVEVTALERGFPYRAIPVQNGVFWDRIPAVIQGTAGIGKETPVTGIYSGVGVASNVLALLGIVLSPAALYLAQTTRPGPSLGISTVWLTGGLGAGILLLGSPLLALRMTNGTVALAETLYLVEPLAGVVLLLTVVGGGLLAFNFFATGGALLFTREVIIRYLLPTLSSTGQRLAARITLGFTFFLVAFMASFMPLISAIAASVVLPLAVQMLPAVLGLTFIPWFSRGAIIAGLILGMLIVVFTEPPGLIVFEALFVDLPWGRWPLTIHSAAWGLVFNFALVLLASAATLNLPDRFERLRLHNALQASATNEPRSSVGLGVLFLVWSFLAYGPGAVLGNTFFSNPIFTRLTAELGVPSLWVWQILFWLIGVLQIWLLAYYAGFGQVSAANIKPISLDQSTSPETPDWLGNSLSRLTRV